MPDTLTTSTGRQGALTREYLARLESRDALATSFFRMRLLEAQQNVEADLQAILARIAAAQEAGEDLSPSWLYRERRYRTLMRRLLDETAAVSNAASREIIQQQKAALELGRAYAQKSMQTAGVDALLGDMDPDVLRAIIGGTAHGTPLDYLLAEVTDNTIQAARAALVTGVSTGKGIPWIRRRFDQAMDIPRWRSETIARTESQRAFRAATQSGFQENAEHLTGWVWTAALDSRTCPACVAMHGSIHALEETLDGHPNCRCVMVPRTPDWDDILGPGHGLPSTQPTIQTGEEWLKDQSDAVQRGVLGPGKWKAWKDGDLDLEDLVAQHSSRNWGTMRREASLAESLAAAKVRKGITAPDDLPAPTPSRRRWDDPSAPLEVGDLPYWGSNTTPMPDEYRRLRAAAKEAGVYDRSWVKSRKYKPEALEDWTDLLMQADLPTVAAQAVHRSDRTTRLIAQRVYNFRAAQSSVHKVWEPDLDVPEDMATAVTRVNPNYERPYAFDDGWQTNCTRATYAYEARRRGLKAKAQPLPPGDEWDIYRSATETAWAPDLEALHKTTTQSWGEIEAAMLKEGEGARGAVAAAWKNQDSAHIWNWEVRDGKVVWVDAQPGYVLDDNQKFMRELKAENARWVRLDNKPLTEGVRSMLDLE